MTFTSGMNDNESRKGQSQLMGSSNVVLTDYIDSNHSVGLAQAASSGSVS
jgi:hypothetical protein